MRSSALQLLKEHTFSIFFEILSIRNRDIFRSTGIWFSSFSSNRSYPRLSLAGSSNASVRVLAGSSNASVQVLAGSSNASVLSQCHLGTVSIASCRRFSNLGFAQPLGKAQRQRAAREGARGGAGEPALQGTSGASHVRGMRQTL